MVALVFATFIQFIAHVYTTAHGLPDAAVTGLHLHEGVVYARAGGVYRLDGDRWVPVTALPFDAARLEPPAPPSLAFPPRFYHRQIPVDLDAEPRCAATDGAGHTWIGTSRGLIVTTGDDYLYMIAPGPGGLPYPDVTALAHDPHTGWVWVGFSEGAAVLQAGRWRYFWGRRWMPGTHVYRIVPDGAGGVWLATDGGVAHLEARRMTLEAKAAHFEQINAARHNRYGFTTECRLADPEDLSTCTYIASDNDGLWTSLTVAAEAFRYAATGDPAARELARTSMQALLELFHKAPGSFVARAIAREDEDNVILSDFSPERWKPSPEAGWLYKTDTSSDEIAGHYFAWYLYSEFVADEQEKRAIAAVARAVTDRLLDDGLRLLRPDGTPTTWGEWSPAALNGDPSWWEERGLNALEILSHLKVAHHLTGEPRFAAAYDSLITRHHYLLNVAEGRVTEPPTAINHSDDELWFVAYYPLGMLERDPARRALLHLSLERSYRTIRPERSPLYAFIYGALTGHPTNALDAIETLERWPWDLRDWTVRNSHRYDLVVDPHRSRPGLLVATTALPIDERSGLMWNRNPYRMDGGRDGRIEFDAAPYLLPYWLGRYHGFIVE
ncbi:hypothetical protein AWN76_015980 [Rhodothermaceae bacterium RA]|nr:hypothetical protein AWN76_015980 [Rhodothermaceae bacterium RA]